MSLNVYGGDGGIYKQFSAHKTQKTSLSTPLIQ